MTVTRWVQRFKAGNESLEDEHRPGRPVSETNSVNIRRIEALIQTKPRISTYDLEELTSLSHSTILRILHDHLGLTKVSAK